jgi:hypothetical protein
VYARFNQGSLGLVSKTAMGAACVAKGDTAGRLKGSPKRSGSSADVIPLFGGTSGDSGRRFEVQVEEFWRKHIPNKGVSTQVTISHKHVRPYALDFAREANRSLRKHPVSGRDNLIQADLLQGYGVKDKRARRIDFAGNLPSLSLPDVVFPEDWNFLAEAKFGSREGGSKHEAHPEFARCDAGIALITGWPCVWFTSEHLPSADEWVWEELAKVSLSLPLVLVPWPRVLAAKDPVALLSDAFLEAKDRRDFVLRVLSGKAKSHRLERDALAAADAATNRLLGLRLT